MKWQPACTFRARVRTIRAAVTPVTYALGRFVHCARNAPSDVADSSLGCTTLAVRDP